MMITWRRKRKRKRKIRQTRVATQFKKIDERIYKGAIMVCKGNGLFKEGTVSTIHSILRTKQSLPSSMRRVWEDHDKRQEPYYCHRNH